MRFSAEDATRVLSALPSGEKLLNGLSFSEDGQYIETSVPSTQTTIYATINSTEYDENKKEIRVRYTYDYQRKGTPEDRKSYVQDKVATLTPDETNYYRITKIEDDVLAEAPEKSGQSVTAAYEIVRNAIAGKDPAYTFPEMEELAPFATGEYQYCLYDMDGDGLQELIVGAVFTQDQVLPYKSCHVYTCEKTAEGYVAQPVEGSFYALNLHASSTGSGLYRYEMMRMTGQEFIYRVNLQDGVLQSDTEAEQTFYRDDADSQAFAAANQKIEWSDISDQGPLENMEPITSQEGKQ